MKTGIFSPGKNCKCIKLKFGFFEEGSLDQSFNVSGFKNTLYTKEKNVLATVFSLQQTND